VHFVGRGHLRGEEASLTAVVMAPVPADSYKSLGPLLDEISVRAFSTACRAATHVARRRPGTLVVKLCTTAIDTFPTASIFYAYQLLRSASQYPAPQEASIVSLLAELNRRSGQLPSSRHLACIRQTYANTGNPLVDVILAKAEQKGPAAGR